jgi:lipoprotein-anchoring transpeptidase ErfK/SrfK
MPGGIENPLGARAMYAADALPHPNSNEPRRSAVPCRGCFRMTSEDVADLYNRARRHRGGEELIPRHFLVRA